MIREGIVGMMPDTEYHAGPELSSTGARELLRSPRTFQYNRSHPRPPKKEFDVGTAAHRKILGAGAQTVVIPAALLASNGAASTTAAKEWIAQARADGDTPVKQETADEVDAMAESILAHPEARELLEQDGSPEMSVFATDPDTGVKLRARFDFLPSFMQDLPCAFDVKTTAGSADRDAFEKVVADLGYDVQEGHYLHTYTLAAGDPTMRLKFLVVEKNPPHLVAVHELSFEFAEIGTARAKHARQMFAQWSKSEQAVWDGYPTHQLPLQPPLWHIYQNQEYMQ